MQKQQLHGLPRSRLGTTGALRGLQGMGQGFGDAEEKQGDADAGGEQHACPRQVAELGFVMVGAELDLAVTGQRRGHYEHQVQGHGQHVVPAHRVSCPFLRGEQPLARLLWQGDHHHAEDQNKTGCEIEDRGVHADCAAGRCTHQQACFFFERAFN
jgi:hypothetical protein